MFLLAGIITAGCVRDELFKGPPMMSALHLNPQIPSENQAVTVTVKVVDMDGLKSVKLFYSVNNGAYSFVVMTAGTNPQIFSAEIPGQAIDAIVNFYIMAENKAGLLAYHPSGAPQTTSAYMVGAALIVMNEIYSRGSLTNPDWIEIYNASDAVVDIGGYLVYDNGGQSGAKSKLPVPAGTIIPAKGFFVIVTDIAGDSGFGLSNDGEWVWLEDPSGMVIDSIFFLAMSENQSFGRFPDGSANWQLLNTITRGTANSNAKLHAMRTTIHTHQAN